MIKVDLKIRVAWRALVQTAQTFNGEEGIVAFSLSPTSCSEWEGEDEDAKEASGSGVDSIVAFFSSMHV